MELAKKSAGFAIPMYSVSVRHPKHGWQVVDVSYTRTATLQSYRRWLIVTQKRASVTARRAERNIPNCWAIIASFDPA